MADIIKPSNDTSTASASATAAGYAFPEFEKFPVGVVFWAGGECFYKFSRTEAVRFEDRFKFDPADGKIKQRN